ncbi:MAG: DUF423 domain-containing protein, partial [Bacteroidetes bacterium SW_7_64_58]
MPQLFVALGAIAAGLAVALGAFGAHGLEGRVSPERVETFRTGVEYQMYHALALLVVGWAVAQGWGPIL